MRKVVDFVVGFLLGGLIGAVAGLILAPQSGPDLRRFIRNRLDETVEGFQLGMEEREAELRRQFMEASQLKKSA